MSYYISYVSHLHSCYLRLQSFQIRASLMFLLLWTNRLGKLKVTSARASSLNNYCLRRQNGEGKIDQRPHQSSLLPFLWRMEEAALIASLSPNIMVAVKCGKRRETKTALQHALACATLTLSFSFYGKNFVAVAYGAEIRWFCHCSTSGHCMPPRLAFSLESQESGPTQPAAADPG